jgi:hypothetical protein
MKKMIQFISSIILAVLLALGLGLGVKKVRAQQASVKSFQIWTHAVDSTNGVATATNDIYFARRSDGTTFKNSDSGQAWLSLPAKGIVIESHAGLDEISTRGLGKPLLIVDNVACKSDDLVPADSRNILGHNAVHRHFEDTFPDSSRVAHDIWVALNFDCHSLLSDTNYYDASGTLVGNDHAEATKAIVGDPPGDVFAVPAGTEVTTTKLRTDSGFGQPVPKTAASMDQRYVYEKAVRDGTATPPVSTTVQIK